MACLIAGDSLAVGIGAYMPQCVTVAAVGRTSQQAAAISYPTGDLALISLGSNDGSFNRLALVHMRLGLAPRRVVWLLPPRRWRADILAIAEHFGDAILDAQPYARSRDGIHPDARGYQALARLLAETARTTPPGLAP